MTDPLSTITFTAGSKDKPNFKVIVERHFHNQSLDDLKDYLARYFASHGGMKWSVEQN